MKNNKLYTIALLLLSFSLMNTACNKTKQHSKWLTGET
jgi:predicted small secreted protein